MLQPVFDVNLMQCISSTLPCVVCVPACPLRAEAKLQARIFTKDLTDEEIDALAVVAVAGESMHSRCRGHLCLSLLYQVCDLCCLCLRPQLDDRCVSCVESVCNGSPVAQVQVASTASALSSVNRVCLVSMQAWLLKASSTRR